jgi:[acyl-carrier-protein] S-malonyltransferase
MIEKLCEFEAENARLVARASEVLERDLRRQYVAANPAAFDRNRDIQVGVFLANHLHAATLARRGIVADRSAGLSLGEYNHLVDIGALSFEDALLLLESRGDAYDRGPVGRMAAVFPVSVDDATEAAASVGTPDDLAVAMRNTPQQQVLSGADGAVMDAVRRLEDDCLAHHVLIDRRWPMHSPLFTAVGHEYRPALEGVAWRTPAKPYLPNLTGRFLGAPCGRDLVEILTRQISEPVHWRQSVEALAEPDDAVFIEVGPGRVLFDMLTPRWIGRPRFRTDAGDDFAASLTRTMAALQ